MYANTSSASLPINSINDNTLSNASVRFEYFEDVDKKYSFEDIVKLYDKYWVASDKQNESFGFSDSQLWVRLNIHNAKAKPGNFVFEIAYPLLDDVTFYKVQADGTVRTLDIGDSKPYFPRDINHPNMLMRFQLEVGENADLHARIETKGSMILPVKIWQEDHFFEFAAKEEKFHFFYYGTLSIIILINLAIFFTLREKLY